MSERYEPFLYPFIKEVRLRRRSFIGRLLRYPSMVRLAHALGVPWMIAARHALVILR